MSSTSGGTNNFPASKKRDDYVKFAQEMKASFKAGKFLFAAAGDPKQLERGGRPELRVADPRVDVDKRRRRHPAEVERARDEHEERRPRRERERAVLREREEGGGGAEAARRQPQPVERPRAEGGAPERLRTVGGCPRRRDAGAFRSRGCSATRIGAAPACDKNRIHNTIF